MSQSQHIKSEIQEIGKLKDIAEIMSAMSAANLALFQKVKLKTEIRIDESSFEHGVISSHIGFKALDTIFGLFNPNYTSFIKTSNNKVVPLEEEYALNVFIGSDMGFCGKFNKSIKDIVRVEKTLKSKHHYIGKQLTSLSSKPSHFPSFKDKSKDIDKSVSVIDIISEYFNILYFGSNPIIQSNTKVIRYIFNVLVKGKIIPIACDINIEMNILLNNHSNNIYNNVIMDLYKSSDPSHIPEYIILDPNIEEIKKAIIQISKQYLISISTTILVESLIAENQVRSSSMETTKDEAQQIMYKLNKKLAKERQAKITGELIELITSFTSLNDSN
ncbi:MAG: F0F1 ATP synthase subunit gamma [Bacteroidota bacterium]